MKREKLNVGIIGCGYFGSNLIRNFSQISAVNLYCACDIDENKINSVKQNHPDIRITSDYFEVLKDPEVDIVVIAVPALYHHRIAKNALIYNKHVLVEKPMTISSNEAKELIELSDKMNKTLMVDHTLEYAEQINKMKEIVESGELGEIYYIRADWLNLGLLQPDVNVVWDLAVHLISVLNYITNQKPVIVNANAEGFIRNNIPEIANIHIKFDKKMSAYLTVSWIEPRKTRTIIIVGSKKLLVFDLKNEEEPIKIYDKGVELAEVDYAKQFKVEYRYGDIYSPNIETIEPLRTMCLHFIDCVINNKKPRSDGESGLKVIKVLEAIDKSLKNKGAEVILEND
ncbi:MAG: Gfo/Idh/MocA family oxidoreductase [Candidatus Nanoarchaeia archaeon]|nr:Gfo/Idh/MocA family oxidoreductase [Candidatus Nanoarchaeia archaeon]MDD5741422.1 Gfo/Idh/MocA family oxidoreductase [Candidatus Nanoarchaeia archaeon]